MTIESSNAKYVELSNQTYRLILDTFAAAMRSRLNYWTSVWVIASRPYSTSLASTVGENFDRATELTNLTVGELRSRVQRTVDFSDKLLAQVGKLQDAAVETYRDSFKPYVSTADQVKDASTELRKATVETYRDSFQSYASTGDQVIDASTKSSGDGFRHWETPANASSVTN